MRTYEALYIVAPDMDDDAIQAVAKGVEDLITSNGGTIARSEHWGRRKLAYEVKKHGEGYYVLLRFEAEPGVVKKLDNMFKLSESVIRFLILCLDARTLKLEVQQQHQREQEAEAAASRSREAGGDDDEDDDFDYAGAGRGRRRGRSEDDD